MGPVIKHALSVRKDAKVHNKQVAGILIYADNMMMPLYDDFSLFTLGGDHTEKKLIEKPKFKAAMKNKPGKFGFTLISCRAKAACFFSKIFPEITRK